MYGMGYLPTLSHKSMEWDVFSILYKYGILILMIYPIMENYDLYPKCPMVLEYLPTKLGHLGGKCWQIYQLHGALGYDI